MNKFLLSLSAVILFAAACTKKDELGEAPRLFRPVLKDQLVSEGNWIRASWQEIKDAVSYTVQLSTDTFQTVAVSMEVDTNTVLFENLQWNKRYQVQVRANAADTSHNSMFSFLGHIKTPVFPSILNIPAISDITDNAVRVSWTTGGAPVTSIRILKASDSSEVALANLDATDVANQFKIISGLQAATPYIVFLYSGTTVRGWADFTTKDALSGNIIDLRGITGRPSVLADTIPIIPAGSTVLLKRGEQYNISSSLALSKAITIMSGSDLGVSTQAIIYFTSNFNFVAGSTIDYIDFKDVYMRSDSYASRYIFNTTAAATVGRISFEDCHAEIFRGICRLQSGATTVTNFIVNRCTIDSIAGYGVITVDNVACKAENISITNSTIYKAEKIITSRQNSTTVLLEDCTINEAPLGTGNYYIDYSTAGTNNVTGGIAVNNCIFGIGKWSAGNINVRGIRAGGSTSINASNNYRTADHVSLGSDIPNIVTYTKTTTQLWQDPAAGDFTIIDNSFPGKSNTGDPKWRQ